MKKLLIAATALSLALGVAAAQAEQADHHDGKTTTASDHKDKTDRTTQHTNAPQSGPATGQQGGHMGGAQGGHMGGAPGGNMMGPQGGHMGGTPGGNMMGPQGGHPTMMGPQNTHMNMGHHPAVDFSHLRGVVRAERHFRHGIYHAPRDYRYHRWNYGERLPAIYFARDYWLSDYADFDLMPPPYGCAWVRYGPDALLVDLESGEVIRVVYGIFY